MYFLNDVNNFILLTIHFSKQNDTNGAKSIEPDGDQIPDRSRGEIRQVMNQYFAHLIGYRPKLQKYITH